jgi:hypothetical protein
MAPSDITIDPANGNSVQIEGRYQAMRTAGIGYPRRRHKGAAKLNYKRALDTIRTNLPRMAPLKALLEIDMGGSEGSLYLDARSELNLVTSAEG